MLLMMRYNRTYVELKQDRDRMMMDDGSVIIALM